MIYRDKMPRSACKVGIIGQLIIGTNGNTQGAVVRVAKTKSLTKRTANRMY